MKLECSNCDLPPASLEPLWGAHHGRFRVSLYTCEGMGTTEGCGAFGAEIFDGDEEQVYLYGCLQKAEEVTVESIEDD